jgi:hypothetical protein
MASLGRRRGSEGFWLGGGVRSGNGVGLRLAAAHGAAAELDAVGVLDQAVEGGVGQGGVGDGLVPGVDGELADDEGGAELVAVLCDLEQVLGLLRADGRDEEVVELPRYRGNSTYPDIGIIPTK